MFKPTKSQSQAIDTKGSVLVTAAAGSGKTAVLVERVVKMICDEENPVSVDSLLIVTFTNAAAAEMRGRIERRLADELNKNPTDRHLKRQMLLLPSAKICTIDTFCINLVRDNFAEFELSPDFKIVTDNELYPIYDAAMTEILGDFYKNDFSRIVGLMDALSCGGDDGRLTEAVLKIFDFTCSMPFPVHWLEGCKKMYSDYRKTAQEVWIPAAGECEDAEQRVEALSLLAPHAVTLLEITQRFSARVNELMRERNMLTFYNTEQMALSLLCDINGDEITVSERAAELSDNFYEILVDEYQDTNDLQDTLFRVLSAGGKKLFAVGDVKQSIYGFRGANPENFVRKKDSYKSIDEACEDDAKKIVLSANFRSRKEICGFVNYLFSLTMSRQFGGVDYNDEEVLVPLGAFPESRSVSTEIHLLGTEDSEDDAAKAEAKHIAAYIKKCMSEEPFLRDGDGLRRANYSDFAILMRSPGNKASLYVEELRNAGIPAYFEVGGFCSSREVNTMLSLLRVISNPTRDVPLISVMMSPVFGFTADEVANFRLFNRKGNFYSALLAAEKSGDGRAAEFLDAVRRFRRMSVTMSVDRLISCLYDETGLLDSVMAMSDGDRRKNNLLQLLQCAKDYDENGGSLDGFADYIEKIGDTVKSSSSGGDGVTIMSFHGSKGLQFSICIIAGCFRRFNKSDSTASLVLDRSLGMSFKALDLQNNTRSDNIARDAISKSVARRNLSEELRVLYVALTRAEERLCVILTGKNHAKKAAATAKLIEAGKETEIVSNAGTYYDWFMYALLCYKGAAALREQLGVKLGDEYLLEPENCKIGMYIGSPDVCYDHSEAEGDDSSCDISEILSRINYEYPYTELSKIAAKTSVSDIVHSGGSAHDFTARPAFLSRSGLTPAQRGTATHKFMQFADYDNAKTDIDAELARLTVAEYITEAEASAVNKTELMTFFESQIFSRMQGCELIREMRFLTEMAMSESCEEKTVVQGVIDCVLNEGDSVSVIDFKTDRVKSEEELIERYKKQLEIYSSACEKMFKKPVCDMLIYSFALGKVIKI